MPAWLPSALLWLVLCAIPCTLTLYFVRRIPPKATPIGTLAGTAVLGAAAGVTSALVQTFVARLTGLEQAAATFGAPSGLLFVLAFSAPLAEGSKVAAAWPAFRSRHFNEEFDGVLVAIAAATGFAAGHSAVSLVREPLSTSNTVRIVLFLIAHPLMSWIWGHALGKVRRTRTPTTQFIVSYVLATLVHGLLLHLTQATSAIALVAAFPVLAGLAFSTWWGARDLLARNGRTSRTSSRSLFPSLPSPNFRAVRHALRGAGVPIHFRWIAIGTATTAGVMLATVSLAVLTGHQVGLDFSAIEHEDTAGNAIAPLVLLTLAVLSAFPFSGYLITKACGAESILEAAIAAVFAIVGTLVLLGMAAPVALVFALAFAPVAFALACVGAWFGLGK